MHLRASALVLCHLAVGEPHQFYVEYEGEEWVDVFAGIMAKIVEGSFGLWYPEEWREVRIISLDLEVYGCRV